MARLRLQTQLLISTLLIICVLTGTILIGAGTTLHGLRVSYAAWWKRTGGANNSEIADLLGDESESMGKHYTRHVDSEVNVTRAFNRLKDGS